MPKPTEKQLADADIVFEHSLYKPKLEPKYPFALVEVDDVPEPDARGLRRVDGFKATWEATVEAGWGNPLGNLHGGAAAWLVDTCTSALLVLVHTDSFWGLPHLSGASITLNMEYYHPAPTGTEVYIDCRIVKCTTTIANTRCEIKDRKTGRVYCMGHHIKAWKAPKGKL